MRSGAGITGSSVAPCGLRPVGIGRGTEPFREVKEPPRCAVVADDPEAEFGREFG